MDKKNWLHLIGVSGKTTANVAKVFQEMGWFVTGSDSQFLPPASNLLEEYKINTAEGYNFKHLTREFWETKIPNLAEQGVSSNPDLVLFISHLTTKNKEYLYARKKGLTIKPYAQILGEYLIKPESIVVAGTAGKTTTTALITFILQSLGIDPSYMIGAEVLDISDSLKITNTKFSVIEGDEYHNPDAEVEGNAKFLEYRPKYLVLTSIGWEHQDIFPTQQMYLEEFKKLVDLVPAEGVIVANANDENIDKVLVGAKAKVIRYSSNDKDTSWKVVKGKTSSKIYDPRGNFVMEFKTNLLGDYNLENILASVVVVLNISSEAIPLDVIREGTGSLKVIAKAVTDFRGAKKRLEKLYEDENLTVIDDFGVAPTRAINSLATLKETYPKHKIIAVFEPNSGSRPMDSKLFASMYKGAFNDADEVLIPDLSTASDGLVETDEMVDRMNLLKFRAKHVSNPEIVDYLLSRKTEEQGKLLIVFFSSYRLTEVAEKLIDKLK